MSRTLILGTSYVSKAKEGAQNYNQRVVELWARLVTHLNPDCDVLIVDSASPVAPAVFLRPFGFAFAVSADDLPTPRGMFRDRVVLELPDNIGHLNITGQDGWGRALSIGLQAAIDAGYQYCAYMDVDIICCRPVQPVIERMRKHGIVAACPMDFSYGFIENGLMFLDLDYVRNSRFIERYDWQSRGEKFKTHRDIPEKVFEDLLGDDLWILPWRGLRDDKKAISVNNLEFACAYGNPTYEFLTHASDFKVYEKLIELHGIKLPEMADV